MSHRRRHRPLSTTPYLVIGGEHDGETISVLSSYAGPAENVVRLPNMVHDSYNVERMDMVATRTEVVTTPYYAHQIVNYPARDHDMPWDSREPDRVWFYSVNEKLTTDEHELEALFMRIKIHRKNADDDRAGQPLEHNIPKHLHQSIKNEKLIVFIRDLLSKREGEPQAIYLSRSNKEYLDKAVLDSSFYWSLIATIPTYFHKGLQVRADTAVNNDEVVVVRNVSYTYVDFDYNEHSDLMENLDRAVFEMPSVKGALHSIAFGRNVWHAVMASEELRSKIVIGTKETPFTLWGARLRVADDIEPNSFTAVYSNPTETTNLVDTFL